jgi:hypothetical protein
MMTESLGSATHESAPPAPPRWKGIQSLDLVQQLNERCIGLLCEMATRAARDNTLPLIAEHAELWAGLGGEARRAAANLPLLIVDAHFSDVEWWRRMVEPRTENDATVTAPNGLPREASEHLMHETTMFAWQTARWDRTVATLSLGIAPSVTSIIAALTPQELRMIATRESQAIRVRWSDDARFWRDLLLAASAGDDKRLAALRLHAKLMLCGELVPFRK